MASNFDFLLTSRQEFHESATEAEKLVHVSPRGACVAARFCLERAVQWMYANDRDLAQPYSDRLGELIYEPTFTDKLARGLEMKVRQVHKLGNRAAHRVERVRPQDAENALQSLHAFLFWVAALYGEQSVALPPQAFRADLLPRPSTRGPSDMDLKQAAALEQKLSKREVELAAERHTVQEQLARAEAHERELATAHEALAAARAEIEAHEARLGDNVVALDAAEREAQAKAQELSEREAELVQAREQVAELRKKHRAERAQVATLRAKRAAAQSLTFDEAETRAQLIDVMLREAGWPVDDPACLEVPITFADGKPGSADYAFFGEDGLPLAVIEAKRASANLEQGKNQAILYADALEREFGRRPVIFYTNGLELSLWDDARGYPPRQILGFYSPGEVERLIARRTGERSLAGLQPDPAIAGRGYQVQAITAVSETFDRQRRRRALLMMATGTGKTRVAVALVELLQRAGWARRVLFLADRVALVSQAARAFRKNLPHAKVINLTSEVDTGSAPVVVSTYPTMLSAVEEPKNGRRRYGPGSFDLVILDEAHRSIYQRYGALLEYFDGRLLGLTATPRDDVDRDTYELFHLNTGLPTFAYELEDAITQGFLVPPRGKLVPFRFLTQGITYEDLSDEEKAEYESKLSDEEGAVPEAIDPAVLNRWIFNIDTVDKALHYLIEHGIKIDGGERLGKTIIFARSVPHARLIVKRFDHHYPRDAGRVARVIVSEDSKSQELITAFSKPEDPLNIAVSVDMLDTGIDVPEIVNLVFFRPVFSKVKFYQMLGRGTRICPDLFGPGVDKTEFLVFDLCGVLDFFGKELKERPTPRVASPSTRLFRGRLALADRLAAKPARPSSEDAVLTGLRGELCRTVGGMNRDNFFVRPVWPLVQRYAERARWDQIDDADRRELLETVAALPSDAHEQDAEARDFDLRCVTLQVALLDGSKTLPGQIAAMIAVVAALIDNPTVPPIAAKLPYIQSLEAEEAWSHASVEMVEEVRRELRSLVRFIDKKKKRAPIYTNFEDELLESHAGEAEVPLYTASSALYARRVTRFIREHVDHLAIAKLRGNRPLTPTDLETLEALLLEAGGGESRERLAELYGEEGSLPAFIRGLVGLDRAAASEAFAVFLRAPGRSLTSAQMGFVQQIIDYLTARGTMEVGILYEPPFSDLAADGPEGLFSEPEIDQLVEIIQGVNSNAAAPKAANDGEPDGVESTT